MASSPLQFPWQTSYLAALTEAAPLRFLVKVEEAEIEIAARLAQDPEGKELELLIDARRTLRFLRDQNEEQKKRAAS